MRPDVALMQPTFLPWQGFFALIAAADVFVFLDDFQFVRRSFHQRNRLFLGGGRAGWLTVPVAHGGSDQQRPPIREMRPDPEGTFRRKLVATLEHAYGRAPFYERLMPDIRSWAEADWNDLAAVNIAFIELACGWLELAPRFGRSSAMEARGRSSVRIADLLRRAGAGRYLCAFGSFDYMKEEAVFPLDDVEVLFQRFEPPRYRQLGVEGFVPFLSILDALMQVGPETTRGLLDAGQSFLTWSERDAAAGAAP